MALSARDRKIADAAVAEARRGFAAELDRIARANVELRQEVTRLNGVIKDLRSAMRAADVDARCAP